MSLTSKDPVTPEKKLNLAEFWQDQLDKGLTPSQLTAAVTSLPLIVPMSSQMKQQPE
jgi:hypothetical protein